MNVNFANVSVIQIWNNHCHIDTTKLVVLHLHWLYLIDVNIYYLNYFGSTMYGGNACNIKCLTHFQKWNTTEQMVVQRISLCTQWANHVSFAYEWLCKLAAHDRSSLHIDCVIESASEANVFDYNDKSFSNMTAFVCVCAPCTTYVCVIYAESSFKWYLTMYEIIEKRCTPSSPPLALPPYPFLPSLSHTESNSYESFTKTD